MGSSDDEETLSTGNDRLDVRVCGGVCGRRECASGGEGGIGNLGLVSKDANAAVADLIVAKLSGSSRVQMVERQELELALKEIELGMAQLTHAGEAIRAGQLLRVDWFVLVASECR